MSLVLFLSLSLSLFPRGLSVWTERPEAEYDHRTLYDKLKQQKDQKQEEWQEQHKFSETTMAEFSS